MFRRVSVFFLFLSLLLPTVSVADVTIFIYHRFGDHRYPSTSVDLNQFREQMAYLRANDYKVLSLAKMVQTLKQGKALPERAAVITIDDGYRDTYTKAWPILRSFGYPFTVFLFSQAVEQGYPDHLSWEQVREMQKAGVDFQDHSYAHHHMGNRPPGLEDDAYRAWIRSDLVKSSRLLTERLGADARYLAIPYGEYNPILLEEARDLGYEAIFSQDPGSVSKDTNRFCIPREAILGEDWSTLQHFKSVLKRVDLPFARMHPPPGLLVKTPQRFSARLLYPERYVPGTLGIYVSGMGWQKASLEGDVLSIPNDQALSRRRSRVAVSGREKKSGKTAIRYWLLLKK